VWIADRVRLIGGTDVDYYHEWKNLRDPGRPELGHHSFLRHDAIQDLRVIGDSAMFTVAITWIAEGDTPVLADTRRFAVHRLGDGEYLIDLAWTLEARYGDVEFLSDAVHYAWPYVRMAPDFSVDGGGTMIDDVGRRGQDETNGHPARWIDCSNTVNGESAGLALLFWPDGEEHVWLTRDYGTFGPRRAATWNGTRFILPHHRSLDGRVGLLVHRGDARGGEVAERYAVWTNRPADRSETP
jgi:hypothetical protein